MNKNEGNIVEALVAIDGHTYRFTEETAIETYYAVLGAAELEMIVRFAGFGSIAKLLEEQVSAKRKLLEATAKLSDVQTKRV